MRDQAWQLYLKGEADAAERSLRGLGRGGQDELHAASELARMAFEAQAVNQYEIAADLARRSVRVLGVERIRQLARREDRAERLALAATLCERVLGDKAAAEQYLAQAQAEDPGNKRAAKSLERLRIERVHAEQKRATAARELSERALLPSPRN